MNWFTIAYLIIIGILVVVFLLRKQVQKVMVWFAQLLFILSLVGALLGLCTLTPFVRIAEYSLENAGTLESLQKIDKALPVSKVIVPVKDLVEQIKGLWKPQPDKVPTPQTPSSELGLLEAEIYPNIVLVTAKTFRSTTMIVSLLGLILSIYLNYNAASINEIAKLQKRVELLEKK